MAEALNGRKRITHTLNDTESNVMTEKTIFCVADASVSGVINCILWDEYVDGESDIDDAVTLDAQKADEKNVTIKKIYDTDTTISQSDFFLLK